MCQICGAASSATILKECKYKKEAVVFYDNCWLRYADYRFFDTATASSDPIGCLANEHDVLIPTDLDNSLSAFLYNLSATAASDYLKFSSGVKHHTGYSVGNGNYTDPYDIYGLVQCTRDLSARSCLSCLQGMIDFIPYCDKKESNRVLSKSCMIRYEKYSFFNFSTFPRTPPSPPTMSAPSPREEWIGMKKSDERRDERLSIIGISIGVVIVVVILFSLAVYYFYQRRTGEKEKEEVLLDQLGGISLITLNGNSEEPTLMFLSLVQQNMRN
ncbi:Cysteine-rich receptor-like protein kinase [Thalictrum thalictroides]|uniref:Cysteine-rich receptor-like protein kinase n=1 Tax=Thalictrum thalictroides TaxID=46969 RepID=A0A7J6WG03_THATH|nr:Cysteine-rich receptor-like protein kinase [Thalictrum thalictroides]